MFCVLAAILEGCIKLFFCLCQMLFQYRIDNLICFQCPYIQHEKKFFLQKGSLSYFTCYFCAGMLQHGLFRFGGWFGGEGDSGNESVSLFSPPLNWIGCCMGLSLSLLLSFLRELRMVHRSGRGPLSATVSPTAMLLSLRYLFFIEMQQ